MSVISLQKGQKIDLTKGNPGLTKVTVGLGWDEAPKPSKGLLSGLFGGGATANIDCDASVIMLDANGKFIDQSHVVYFGNLQSPCRSVKHSGDNLTGAGDGDDEQIFVELAKIPAHVHRLVFVVNIYDCVKRKQDFGMIRNAFIRVVNNANNQELCRYNLTEDYSGKTALVVAEIYRYNNEWKFSAIGEGTTDTSIGQLISRYA